MTIDLKAILARSGPLVPACPECGDERAWHSTSGTLSYFRCKTRCRGSGDVVISLPYAQGAADVRAADIHTLAAEVERLRAEVERKDAAFAAHVQSANEMKEHAIRVSDDNTELRLEVERLRAEVARAVRDLSDSEERRAVARASCDEAWAHANRLSQREREAAVLFRSPDPWNCERRGAHYDAVAAWLAGCRP